MKTDNKLISSDYKDLVYRLTYFLLGKCAPLIPSSIRPNQITFAGFIAALIGTFLLYKIQTPAAYLYWLVFNFLWYLLDALDGIHARRTQQSSEFGAFLDHALDNIYFVFMLTVFVIKFDLAHTIYIYILLLRVTAATLVFLVQCHTKRLYLSRCSGGTELLLFSLVMVGSYYFPHFNLAHYTANPLWLYGIDLLSLEKGLFMKLALWVYAIGVPVTIVLQFRFVKKELSYKAG